MVDYFETLTSGLSVNSFDTEGYLPPPLSNPHISSELRDGLIAFSFFGLLSVITTFCVLVLIVYGIISQRHDRGRTLIHNQLLTLIANLFIADMLEALAGCISLHWLRLGKMLAPTAACSIQAILLHMGILSNGLFVLAIAVITWVHVVWRETLRRWLFYSIIGGIWAFALILSFEGLIRSPHDFFASIGPCCWISPLHRNQAIWLLCLWVFGTQTLTILIYTHIFFNLRTQVNHSDARFAATSRSERGTHDALRNLAVFPIIFLATSLPLCIAMTMGVAKQYVPLTFEIVAGIMVSWSGWIDCILYTLTRKKLFFGD
ncbi:hypothetical protein EV356DRAFT_455041, partial [Viridothelium virens]